MNYLGMIEPVYLATPYTRYCKGLPGAYLDACKIAAAIHKEHKIIVFCPIAHCHGMTTFQNGLPPIAHEFWENFNRPFIAACGGLIVAKLEGWENSSGIAGEISGFRAAKKPILYCDPETLELAA